MFWFVFGQVLFDSAVIAALGFHKHPIYWIQSPGRFHPVYRWLRRR